MVKFATTKVNGDKVVVCLDQVVYTDLLKHDISVLESLDLEELKANALMEFGALHCTPRIPDCTNCPLAKGCVARKQNLQAMLPVKIAAAPKKERYFNYLLLEKDGKIWMKKRDAGDIGHGL